MTVTTMGPGPGQLRFTQTFIQGLQGAKPAQPFDLAALVEQARAAMTPEGFDYVAGGAGAETTIDANRAALDAVKIVPRMLRDVSSRDLTVSLFGRTLPAPFLLAPIGVQELAHPEADLATARAAAGVGVPMIFSNQASVPMETTAAAMGDGPRAFQLYWTKSDALARSFVERAEACGCEAIFVTLDTTMLGWRVRDLNHGYLPFLHGLGIAQYTSDPVFRDLLAEPPEQNRMAAAALFTQIYSDPTLDWAKLKQIRSWTRLPIVLKGIQHPDDAMRAVDEGWDGIVVSNHGGRQVDGAVGSAATLAACAAVARGRIKVLFDSGVRTGADVFKALALGADAVLLGRPYVYGLAAGGQAGVEAVIANLIAEFDLTLGLAGLRKAADIDRKAVQTA